MEETKKEWGDEIDYSYSLIYKQKNVIYQDEAIAVFTENSQNEQIFIAYFEKENEKWNWRQSTGAEWDTPVQWSSMIEEPFIYAGAIRDDSISEI